MVDGWIYKLFYMMYSLLGMRLRFLFIDFVGIFIPFTAHFYMIANEGDMQCGTVKSD